MEKHRVSIIIPVYNSEKTVAEALESVAAQTYTDYEIIVVNDGSGDQSKSIIKKYMRPPLDITYVEQANKGPAAARNAGLRLAKGEFIAFLDADDTWDRDKLARQIKLFEENPGLGLVYCDMKHVVDGRVVHDAYLREKGYTQATEGRIYDNLLKENFIFTPAVLVKKSCLDAVGGFREDLKIGEDFDLWLRIAAVFPVGMVAGSLVTRHRHTGNITRDRALYAKCLIRVYEDQLIKNRDNAQRRALIGKKLEDLNFSLGYHAFRQRQWRTAAGALQNSARRSLKTKVYLCLALLLSGTDKRQY